MKIAVCVSFVPDTASKIKISAESSAVDTTGLTFILNPYDEFAIEEALKLKEKLGGEVHIFSMGNDTVKEGIRKALAMGADEGSHLKTDISFDAISTAKALADAIKNYGAELVLVGKQSVDTDGGVMAQLIAEFLDWNAVPSVTSLTIEGVNVTAESEIEGGKEVISTSLPCVISTQKGLNDPRYASLKGIMASKKKNIAEIAVVLENLSTTFISASLPPAKPAGRILGSDSSAVSELVRLLKDEAKVL